MTREQKMLAVVEAARQVLKCEGKGFSMGELRQALAALDTPDTGEMEAVEVQAHVRLSTDGGAYIISGMGALNNTWIEPRPGVAFATITARVPLPTVPTIPATVTLPITRERGE